MRKAKQPILIALFFGVVLSAIFGIFPLKRNADCDLAGYWPSKEGSSWGYNITKKIGGAPLVFYKEVHLAKVIALPNTAIEEFVYSDGNRAKYVSNQGHEIAMYKEVDETGTYTVYSPPLVEIPAHIKRGGRLSQDYAYVEYEENGNIEGTGKGRADIVLLEKENIRVKDMYFRNCLKFLHRTKWKDSMGEYGATTRTFWLAPGIGKVYETEIFIEYDKKNERSMHIIKTELCQYKIK